MLSKSFWSLNPIFEDELHSLNFDDMFNEETESPIKETFCFDPFECVENIPEMKSKNPWLIEDEYDTVVRQDCMWCADYNLPSNILTDSNSSKQSEKKEDAGLTLVKPELVNSSIFFRSVVPDTVDSSCVTPYTPDNDHSYYQPKSVESHAKDPDTDSVASDSASESSGDEIDIEYVTPQSKPHAEIVKNEIKRQEQEALQKLSLTNSKKTYISRSQKRTRASVNITSKRIKIESVQMNKRRGRHNNSMASYASCSSRSCSDSDEMPLNRSSHNDSERRRRDIQRNALQNLREAIPHLKDNLKAAKVKILNEASDYCDSLTHENKEALEMLKELKKTNTMLQKKFEKLKHEFACFHRQ